MQPVIVITGASRGIGAAIAELAAARGYAVAVNYLTGCTEAAAVVGKIADRGGTALAVCADVAVEADVMQMFAQVRHGLGPVSALVNNAGILEPQMPLRNMTAARMTRVLLTNVLGSMVCAREAVRCMSKRTGGTGGAIVNVSSRAAQLGSPDEYVDYAASKAALDAFTVGLAKEAAADGIRVNAVRPGLIHTGMHASGGEAGRVTRLQHSVPLRRGGEPIEVAHAVLWLLSAEASYVTGALLDVGGGR